MTNSQEQPLKPMQRIMRMQRVLNGASERDIVACLEDLRRQGLMAFPNGFSASEAIPQYVRTLMEANMGIGPLIAVKKKMLNGEYTGFGRFMPTPPELMSLCFKEHEALRAKINDEKRADKRRDYIRNLLSPGLNNRQAEEEIDRRLCEADGIVKIAPPSEAAE